MIVKTDPLRTRAGSRGIVHHLLEKTHENERIRLIQGSGEIIDQYYQISRASSCPDGCVHIKLSPAEHEIMNESDWAHCLSLLADEFKFNADYATVVEHTKKGRTHRHIVVPAFDLNSNKRLNLWRSHVRSMKLAKQMEIHLGHDVVPLPALSRKRVVNRLKRDGNACADLVDRITPDAGDNIGYGHKETSLARRFGHDIAELRSLFVGCVNNSDNVRSLHAALKANGFELTNQEGKRQNRYYFRAIDTPELSLNAAKLLGVRTKKLLNYLENGNADELFSTRTTAQNRSRNRNSNLSGRSGRMGRDNREAKEQKSRSENSGKQPKTATVTADERIKKSVTYQPSTSPSAGPGRPVIGSRADIIPDTQHGGRRPKPVIINEDHAREGKQQRRSESSDRHSGGVDIAGSGIRSGAFRRGGNEAKTAGPRPDIERDITSIDPAIRAQQQRLNSLHTALQDALVSLSGISPRQNPLIAFYGLQNAHQTGLRVQYQNVCKNRQHPVTPDVIERVVSYWDERVSRGSVVSAHGEQRSSRYPYGCYAVQMKGGTVIRDTGDALGVSGPVTSEAAREMVAAARARGWSYVELNGSDRFRDEVAIQCAINGVACNHELSPAASIRLNKIQRAITAKSVERLERDLM